MTCHVFTIDAADPCLDGHFPDRPIVPAVVVLERVIEAVRSDCKRGMAGIRRCRFTRALLPGVACTLEWWHEGTHGVRFNCRDEAGPLAHGVLELTDSTHG